jgi:hypothetical protein
VFDVGKRRAWIKSKKPSWLLDEREQGKLRKKKIQVAI